MKRRSRTSALRGRTAARWRHWSLLGGLGALEAAGLGLLLVVVPVVFDPFGLSGYLAVKVLAAGVGVGLVVVSLVNSWSVIRNDHDFERARTAETYHAAYGHLSNAADRRSFDDEPYILMGALLQSADRMELLAQGEVRIRRGESLNPGNEAVSLGLAEVRLQGFRVSSDPSWAQRARTGLDDLIESQPTNGVAYLKRGVAHYYLDDFASAEADWERAAWLLPEDPTPLDNLEVLREQQAAGR